ncbi:hypothetical protein J3A83DRAFT_4091774 [Scleroderma citrinum]
MKLSYPSPNDAPFTNSVLALKIARHTPCSTCDTCQGLRPPLGVELVLGDDACHKSSLGDLNQYGSDEDEPTCLETCVCGHDVAEHGADEVTLGREEFFRRARLAIRLDEMLQEADRLLDFEYVDDHMLPLRQTMQLPVSLITMSPASAGESAAVSLESSLQLIPILQDVHHAQYLQHLLPRSTNLPLKGDAFLFHH